MTNLVSYIIPEVPRSIKTQKQREHVLEQEAKYERGIRNFEDEEKILTVLREAGFTRPGVEGIWHKRITKISNLFEERREYLTTRNQTNDDLTVLEVT